MSSNVTFQPHASYAPVRFLDDAGMIGEVYATSHDWEHIPDPWESDNS